MYVKSMTLDKVQGVLHGFGTFDESIPSSFSEIWNVSKPQWKQVHGAAIARVESFAQHCGEVDALYTQAVSIPIGVVTADCVPIIMTRRDGSCVAAIHAGWRGTQARILKVLWDELSKRGELAQHWVAAIGPAIGPCCYEVSEELAESFSREFSEYGARVAVPKFRTLDLPAINQVELEKIGLQEVDLIRACTRCSVQPRFHSYRREGSGTRQYSLVMRVKS